MKSKVLHWLVLPTVAIGASGAALAAQPPIPAPASLFGGDSVATTCSPPWPRSTWTGDLGDALSALSDASGTLSLDTLRYDGDANASPSEIDARFCDSINASFDLDSRCAWSKEADDKRLFADVIGMNRLDLKRSSLTAPDGVIDISSTLFTQPVALFGPGLGAGVELKPNNLFGVRFRLESNYVGTADTASDP